MSLFNSKKTQDKWEKKYFSLIDEHERLEKDQQKKEQLLCKIITRLALVATGVSPQLDPYLTQIRKQLKKGLINDNLKQQLEQFSDTLLKLDETSDKQDPEFLIQFLQRQFPRRKTEFDRVYKFWQQGKYTTQHDMLLALHELVDEEQAVVSDIPQQQLDVDLICRQLLKLLENTEIPEPFSQRAETLKIQLQDGEPLPFLLEETLTLLSDIKKHLLQERQDMARFLSQISSQLNALGNQTQGISDAFVQGNKKRNLLDQSFTQQMQDLQENSANATELDSLKQLISSSLENITQQLQQHQQQEKAAQQQTQQKIDQLSSEIKRLENESSMLETQLQQARHLAFKDPLTQLPNRLAYDERLEAELARFRRTGTPLSMAIWDIDFFKKINDNFGHKAGDKTLQIIGRLLQQHCRKMDFIARFGGEEFVMLLPDTDSQAALIIAEKLRKTIEKTGFNSGGHKIRITVSCGISQFNPDDTAEAVFKRADAALYKAKNNGRNQCVIEPAQTT